MKQTDLSLLVCVFFAVVFLVGSAITFKSETKEFSGIVSDIQKVEHIVGYSYNFIVVNETEAITFHVQPEQFDVQVFGKFETETIVDVGEGVLVVYTETNRGKITVTEIIPKNDGMSDV